MNILLVFLMLIIIFIIVFYYERKIRKYKNKVHFYVARDKDCSLWIYIGKPTRGSKMFYKNDRCRILGKLTSLYMLGLDENDYANLKWEDEPVEVFLNLED